MEMGDLITVIDGIEFFYYGYNEIGKWHLICTDKYNFHIEKDKDDMPTERDCEICYKNTYL